VANAGIVAASLRFVGGAVCATMTLATAAARGAIARRQTALSRGALLAHARLYRCRGVVDDGHATRDCLHAARILCTLLHALFVFALRCTTPRTGAAFRSDTVGGSLLMGIRLPLPPATYVFTKHARRQQRWRYAARRRATPLPPAA